jgi:hypothetical protein
VNPGMSGYGRVMVNVMTYSCAYQTGVFSSVMANVTSVPGVSKIVTQAPSGIVEFSTHLGKLTVRRNMKCMRSLTVSNYLTPPTLSPISGAVLLGYLLILPPRTLYRVVQLARERTPRRTVTIRPGIMP